MADATDAFRAATDVMSGGREQNQADGREEFDRARYLAKAASLGQMVPDHESLGGEP